MATKYNTLIMGASYGSLLAIKLVLAGYSVRLVCLPEEAELFNKNGAIVRMPVRGRDGLVEINSNDCPGALSAGGTDDAILLSMISSFWRCRSRNIARPVSGNCWTGSASRANLACRS